MGSKLNVVNDVKKFQKKRVKEIPKEFKHNRVTCFPNKEKYNGIVLLEPIDFSAKCEHHLVSIHGRVYIAYQPSDILIGLSQIARIVETFLNPTIETIQERATKQICDKIDNLLQPQGVMVIIKAEHECMTMRGVKQRNCRTTTSEVRGVFHEQNIKSEVFELIKLR